MKKVIIVLFVIIPSLIYAKTSYQEMQLKYKGIEFDIKVEDKIYVKQDTVNIIYAIKNKSGSSIWICDDKIQGDNACGVYFSDKDLNIYLGLGGNRYVEFRNIPKYIEINKGKSHNTSFSISCNQIAESYTSKHSIKEYSIYDFPISANIALFEGDIIRKLKMNYITQFDKGSGFLKSDVEIIDYEFNIKRINISGINVRIDLK
ncbi:MAG: hypothetical protein KJ620_01625 [Candidatus Edwardsbacteria bacterium]|nr:hypothetical protein [Candidatus Edwardsbacteria bacterium]MBU1577247.1 hypothetical protein [Candidatus Edwardsbacteria bacterium]MBU2463175.1 hypothetical protein [Candidatus Edwardsbacteria bacterium]MBU2592918.1 hypothetical protein [Candidatus Edwardsbacteria bacterium]